MGLVWFVSAALVLDVAAASFSSSGCYKTIYSFGDSLTDTGNSYYDTPHQPNSLSLNPPYGETYFHHPTGRWCDGRLVIDFFALHMGIPLLKPYLGIKNGKIQDWNTREGLNFAVAGATALDLSFFADKGIFNVPTNYSLRVQLDWFNHFLPSICNSSSDCKEVLGSSLFLLEIGGNDFNYPFFLYKSLEEIKTYVPRVVNEISSAINHLDKQYHLNYLFSITRLFGRAAITLMKLIDLGAQTLMVLGNLPLGCNLVYLTRYPSTNMEEYDQAGCLKWLNKFAAYYNEQLCVELNRLQVLHPHTNIICADFYHAALPLYQSPRQFGFTETILDACCGSPNNASAHCGYPGVNVCDDPSQYISWDGLHLTEAAYKWIAEGLLNGPYTDPKISLSCDSEI